MSDNQKQIAIKLVNSLDDLEQQKVFKWANDLLDIRKSELSTKSKVKEAVKLTKDSEVIFPVLKRGLKDIKKIMWDDRGLVGRLSLSVVSFSVVTFGSQGMGLAAFGGAIGVPIWMVCGGGAAFAGYIIEDINNKKSLNEGHKTTYNVIDAEKIE